MQSHHLTFEVDATPKELWELFWASQRQNLDYEGVKTRFHGYDTLSHEGRITALYKDGSPVESLMPGEKGVVVLDQTPF